MPRCPICRAETASTDVRFRPFCSERCRLVDLSAWTSERYRIPGETVVSSESAPDDDPS